MRVAFFHDSVLKYDSSNDTYYTSGGLTNSYLKRYLEHFDDVLMVTRSEKIKKSDDKSKLSVTSGKGISFDCVSGSGVKALIKKTTKRKAIHALKDVDFAIIRLPSIIGIIACRECNKLGKPYLIEMVGSPFCALWYYGKLSYRLAAPFYALENRHLVRKANNIIYVTKEYLQHSYPNHRNNIGISDVNIEEIDDSVLEKRKKRIKSYTDKTVYKIGLIGSMDVKYKGHDIAIKSIPLLRRKGINVEMHFLGKCSKQSEKRLMEIAIKNNVSDAISIDGVLPGGKGVYNWIDEKDFIILPSKQEGLPRSIIESMSRASICVGTATGGIPELLPQDCIMRRKNSKELANILLNLIHNKDKMNKISKRNYVASEQYEHGRLTTKRNSFFNGIKDSIEKERINVLNIAGGLNVGGAETFMLNVLRTINKDKYRMFYLCYSKKEYDYEKDMNKMGGTILRMNHSGPFHDVRAIRKIIKTYNINVVHCHTHFNSVFAVIAAKISGVKVITHSHTTQDVKASSSFEKLYQRFSKLVINKYSDYLFACGSKAAKSLFYNKEKIVMINNGIILSDFEYSLDNRNRIRAELELDDNDVAIGHVGRLAKPKNHSFILDVFAKYYAKNEKSVLILVGDGDLRSSIEKKADDLGIRSKIRFLGLRMDTNAIYSAFDVFLFPSLFEGMPTCLVEAQMNGLPILASDVIDSKIDITGRIKFLPLKLTVERWADSLDKLVGKRYDGSNYLYGGSYDMLNEIKRIEEYYGK